MKKISTVIKVALVAGVFGLSALVTVIAWSQNGFWLTELNKLEKVLPILLLRSQLKSLDGNMLTVAWHGREYKVIVTPQTKLWRRNGSPANLKEFKPGNNLRLSGRRLDDDTIEAAYIHNSSLEIGLKTIIGLVDKLDLAENSFVLKSSTHGLIVVKADARTQVINQGNQQALSNLTDGQKVIVKGLYDRSRQLMSPVQKIVIFPD